MGCCLRAPHSVVDDEDEYVTLLLYSIFTAFILRIISTGTSFFIEISLCLQ
jgi:hypothetical protein